MSSKITLRSRILEYFPEELYEKLFKISCVEKYDLNTRIDMIKMCLDNYDIPYTTLGGGTNRFAVMIDGYACKIAYDYDGRYDNLRELYYSRELYPCVAKSYECSKSGLILFQEYVTPFDNNDLLTNTNKIKQMLTEIGKNYILGDVGCIGKNYTNWGIRKGTKDIVMLDYAYIYPAKSEMFQCYCEFPRPYIQYNQDFSKLICPKCGRIYSFGDLSIKISYKYQTDELLKMRDTVYSYNSKDFVIKDKKKGEIEVPYNEEYHVKSIEQKHEEEKVMNARLEDINLKYINKIDKFERRAEDEGMSRLDIDKHIDELYKAWDEEIDKMGLSNERDLQLFEELREKNELEKNEEQLEEEVEVGKEMGMNFIPVW